MKFLAWDIGIKNLAYSVINYDDQKTTKTILKWGVINLMESPTDAPKKVNLCCETSAKGKKCTAKVAFVFNSDPDKGLCKKHRQMIKYKASKFLDITKKITCVYQVKDKLTKEDKKAGKPQQYHTCGKTATFCSRKDLTKSYCNQHLKVVRKKDPFEVYEIKVTKKAKAMGQPLLKLSENLFKHLDAKENDFLDLDEVIIENQPVFKNPTMKTIQILLYSWFVMKGYMEDKVKNINFFSASKKLEAYDDQDDKIAKTVMHLGSQYQINKKLAVLYTQEMIKNNPTWKTFFETHKKKDDLADAYLTNCYYIDREIKKKTKKKDTKKTTDDKTVNKDQGKKKT